MNDAEHESAFVALSAEILGIDEFKKRGPQCIDDHLVLSTVHDLERAGLQPLPQWREPPLRSVLCEFL
ncbi:MAG: hypothetical protein H7A55_14635 [Verrucomicrobiaceae bacterium]|nr:hypothetical protein [Verrucomicrobiaceae bacterium]